MSASGWRERSDAFFQEADAEHMWGDELGAKALALVNERLDDEGLRGKVWMAMPYACDSCRAVAWYECEVGVEGPPEWRDDQTFVASPFTAGRCGRCRGSMTHVMHCDAVFDGPRDPGEPFGATGHVEVVSDRVFRVPREPVRWPTEGCDEDGNVIYAEAAQAFLSLPRHAIGLAAGG